MKVDEMILSKRDRLLDKLRKKGKQLSVDLDRIKAFDRMHEKTTKDLLRLRNKALILELYNEAKHNDRKIVKIKKRRESLDKLRYNIADQQKIIGKLICKLKIMNTEEHPLNALKFYTFQGEALDLLLNIPHYNTRHYQYSW